MEVDKRNENTISSHMILYGSRFVKKWAYSLCNTDGFSPVMKKQCDGDFFFQRVTSV